MKNILSNFSNGLKNLGILGLICILAEDVALIFAFYDAFFNSVYKFLIVQDISIVPMVLTGITICTSVKFKLPKQLKNNIRNKSWYLCCFWFSCIFIILIAMSILTTKISWLSYIIKYSFERVILLLVDLAYIIVIEVSDTHLSDFLIGHLIKKG